MTGTHPHPCPRPNRTLPRTRTLTNCSAATPATSDLAGWRLGWLVAPDHLDSCIDALNQNMNVSAPTVSQRAAVAALGPEAKLELQAHLP